MTSFCPFESHFFNGEGIVRSEYEERSSKCDVTYSSVTKSSADAEWETITALMNLTPKGERTVGKDIEQKALEKVYGLENQPVPLFSSYSYSVSQIKNCPKRIFAASMYPVRKSQTTTTLELNQTLQIQSQYCPMFLNVSTQSGEEWAKIHHQYIQYCLLAYRATYAVIVSIDALQDNVTFVPQDSKAIAIMRVQFPK